ncbi:hypothetical protein [Bacillus thuringiensis]|uniref:hypothetical protein n=1 Tax=Bacillus thuringiensis TaxID=1428 RepID=UPI00115CF693|nr:hypothetical protein [Bacillus thuringiensis]
MFDYKQFSKSLYMEFKEIFTLDEVNDLLKDLDEYEKDTPISTGKRLTLIKICIKGQKSSGEKIDFSLPLYNGVNILVADNFKGKSSLFKMIQLALTGNNKLKPDMKKWINSIILAFKINDKTYSAIIIFKNSRMKGALYSEIIDEIEDISLKKLDPIFETIGTENYEEFVQEFFFKQFSYYSLKWTQKNSKKDKNELLEAKASWKTYFKSIYLESKDSTSLVYGNQGKKVFQMLLGLELTYAINQLSVKKDFLQFNKAKQDHINQINTNQIEKDCLKRRKDEIEKELTILNSSRTEKGTINKLYEEYDERIKEINDVNALIIKNRTYLNEKFQEKSVIEFKISSNINEMNRLRKEINKTDRAINDMEEYIEVGMLFSNLDIKHCPNCNHRVSKNFTHNEKTCLLCHTSVRDYKSGINKEIYYQKLDALKIIRKKLIEERELIQHSMNQLKEDDEKVSLILTELESKLANPKDTLHLRERLLEIESGINKEKEKINPENDKKIDLNSEKAVIEYRLAKLVENPLNDVLDKEKKKIDLLNQAIVKLNKLRYKNSKKILDHLSDIMLDELHRFGLTSITEIRINENFDIHYKQNGDYITFDGIAEGEQLRAKIALYLSIIQLDIEYNFGRHTRFLIIDSPNKEEGDSKYLNGLTDVLKDIDNRYGEKLQIIIGTAERGLENIVKNEKVVDKGGYVF